MTGGAALEFRARREDFLRISYPPDVTEPARRVSNPTRVKRKVQDDAKTSSLCRRRTLLRYICIIQRAGPEFGRGAENARRPGNR